MKIPIGRINATCKAFYLIEHSCLEELFFDVRNCVNVSFPPDHILIICPTGLEERISDDLRESATPLDRGQLSSHSITILPFDVKGELIEEKTKFVYGEPWTIPNNMLNLVASGCISSAIHNTKAIIEAPHGYHFRKPSGKKTNVFARSGNLLIHQELAIVFCQCLLLRLPGTVKKLYIDSFTIHSFALCLQSLLAYFSRHTDNGIVVPSIESFHSYNRDANFRLPNTNDYFVIISASTSGDLRNILINQHNADSSKIVHLIGIGTSASELNQSSIHFEERTNTDRIPVSSEIVPIDTEEFMAFFGETERVRLTQKHVPKNITDDFVDPYYTKNLHCNGGMTAQLSAPKSLFSIVSEDYEGTSWSEKFTDWLKNIALYELPVSAKTIVHLDDQNSKRIGERVKEHIENRCGADSISLLSEIEFNNSCITEISSDSTLVIVGGEDPDLEKFSAINLRLRNWSGLNRHFILGYAFPASKRDYKQQSDDLKHSESYKKHGWSDFKVVPIGRLESHESLIMNYGVELDRLNELLSSNENLNIDSSCGLLFFPAISGDILTLRRGSIFFPSNSEHSKISQSLVYLVVSASIQMARENDNQFGKGMRLKNGPFVRPVIDPLMFTRFNDGVIQAAILRALEPSELDYSNNATLSAQFRRITSRVIDSYNEESGEAVLEFLAAIASRKVALMKNDFEHIEKKVTGDPTLNSFWELFLETSF